MNASLKLVHSESHYRLIEIQAVTQRISEREAKIALLKERLADVRRQLGEEEWLKMLDINRLTQLKNGRARPKMPAFENEIV
jgi:hypothetical protein